MPEHHIDLGCRKICSICGDRKSPKGSTRVEGRFVCSDCKPSDACRTPKAHDKNRAAALAKARKEALRAEVESARERHRQIEAMNRRLELDALERSDLAHADLLSKAMAMIEGDEFRAWYEAMTGDPVEDWIARLTSTKGINIGEHGSGWRWKLLDRIDCWVNVLTDRNPWTNPENRMVLCDMARNTRDPMERRRIMLRMATPRWSDMSKVVAIYRERDRIVSETGIPHDVDHIVPIINRLVCGLHCEHNLRVITASENRSKSNKHQV